MFRYVGSVRFSCVQLRYVKFCLVGSVTLFLVSFCNVKAVGLGQVWFGYGQLGWVLLCRFS